MRPLIWLPLRDVYRVEDVNVLVNGGFETAGGPPPTGWSQASLLATRIAGQRTGGAGSWICQCDWDTVNASGYIGQVAACAVGCPYHITGWYKSTGAVTGQLYAGLSPVTIPSSAVWAPIDGIVTCTTNSAALVYSIGLGAGKAMQWDDLSYRPFKAYTKNLGSSGDVFVGNGLASITMPTMLTPNVNVRRGMAVGSAQYLTAAIPALNNDGAVMAVVQLTPAAAAAGAVVAQIGVGTTWWANGLFLWYQAAPGRWQAYWGGSGSSIVGPTISGVGLHTVCVSCIGGQVSLYVDGKLAAGPTAAAGAVTKTDLSLFGDPGGSYPSLLSNAHEVCVSPTGFTAQQAAMLSERMLSEVSI